jgi:hypothetical protein
VARRPKKGPFAAGSSLVALAGRHVKWTSLAVQQQRFETDSNADQTKPRCLGIAASICALLTPLYKEHFDYRNS